MMKRFLTPALFLSLLQLPAHAVPPAYERAAMEAGVPSQVFYSLALVESGHSRWTGEWRPWPWTLSIDSRSHYFATRQEAEVALHDAIERGVSQLGVGLFQIEHGFHHHRFSSPDEMLDPYRNSLVAADILREMLEQENGDVWAAIGRFHSATPGLAEAYRLRVAERLVRILSRTEG